MSLRSDVLVIGAGSAGLSAALRLAQAGAKVQLIASGDGSLPLAPATIDVLGYAPDLVEDPLRALPRFATEHPEHPYAVVGVERIRSALAWIQALATDLGYRGELLRNRLVPTALGGLRPAGLVPATMTAAALEPGSRVLVASFNGYRDFYPRIVAANLGASALGLEARAAELIWEGESTDLVPQRLWRRMEEPQVRRRIAAMLRPRLEQAQAVGFPAILGREHSQEVEEDLESLLERPVFEISTLPPSLPGLRLKDLLVRSLRRAGGRVTLGSTAVSFRREGARVLAVRATQAPREEEYQARSFVLASGGIGAGGIEMDPDQRARETVFGLPLAQLPDDSEEWFQADYLAHHRFDRVGVRVDPSMRPLGPDGAPIFENLFVAGAQLQGAEPWREKSGEGISLVTALRAAEAALEVSA